MSAHTILITVVHQIIILLSCWARFYEVNVNIAYKLKELLQGGLLIAFHTNVNTPASFCLLPPAYRKHAKYTFVITIL